MFSTPRHGYYSQQACDLCGSNICLDTHGNEVEVTAHFGSTDNKYSWPDTVYVGLVTAWIRPGVKNPDRLSNMEHIPVQRTWKSER